MTSSCPLCSLAAEQIVWEADGVVAIRDRSPVTPGHTLVVLRRHAETYFDATAAEQAALWRAVEAVKAGLDKADGLTEPHGYNVGFNAGEAAGQTVMHLHVHVIPRHHGDTPHPRGGVRGVLPGKRDDGFGDPALEFAQRIVVGDTTDPLLHALLPALDGAHSVDLAVAFIFDGGVRLLRDRLRQVLEHPAGRVRIVTGDYQGVTEPEALRHLLSLRPPPTAGLDDRLVVKAFRVPLTRGASFHPKAWVLRGAGLEAAWIGSSNMSATALQTGVEWNAQLVVPADVDRVAQAFERLWEDPRVDVVDEAWIREYEERRPLARRTDIPPEVAIAEDGPAEVPRPRPGVQTEALLKLEQTRDNGNKAGLVVLATGLGKTFLSAFDSRAYHRVLFVAHREEILTQALDTFRSVRPNASAGLYYGKEKSADADLLFASVQTLTAAGNLDAFAPDHFDYIVIDEFHHAAADTYRRVIDHFEPDFMLGLTATPERLDGANILALCEGNEVYRADIARGITDEQLAPFRYFGIGDTVEYQGFAWNSDHNDELAARVSTQARAEHALETLRAHTQGRVRALGFCVSKRHADVMTATFAAHGVDCAAVYTGSAAKRTPTLEALDEGALEIVFCVDMFNEGVDVPNIDTVFMLRPTKSSIIWLQQLGRGLRFVAGKTLTVLDYIGNHGAFLRRPELLLGALNITVDAKTTPWDTVAFRSQLPAGVHVEFDLHAQDVLESLRQASKSAGGKPQRWYREFRTAHDRRPSALEAHEAGWFAKLSKRAGGWFDAVAAQGDLTADEAEVLESGRALWEELETLRHPTSELLLVLWALLDHPAFPAGVAKRELGERISVRLRRSAVLMRDIEVDGGDARELVQHLAKTGFARVAELGGGAFFRDRQRTVDAPGLGKLSRAAVVSMLRELVELQLARYLDSRNTSALQIPPIRDDDGEAVDARFDVQEQDGQTTLIVHSRGGTRGSGTERNTQYREGLTILLQRLHHAESTVQRIEVDSAVVHREGLTAAQRTIELRGFAYPLRMKRVQEFATLARAIGVGMKSAGQAQGKTGGNDTRRIRIFLRDWADPGELWRRLWKNTGHLNR